MNHTTGTYKGWQVIKAEHRWLNLSIAPQLGGRVIQLEMDHYGYLFTHPLLEGKEPDHTRLGENGKWLNFGGEKIWPAPQGWASPGQWPGPPDPVLDSGEFTCTWNGDEEASSDIILTSPSDPCTGLQISRKISLLPGFSGVDISVTFFNKGDSIKKWSVWPVCQINTPEGEEEGQHQIVCPVNTDSLFPAGFKVMHGLVNNPQFRTEVGRNLVVTYGYLVGKVGLDTDSNWMAYINRHNGKALVLRFNYEKGKSYPENTSVQIWTQGRGVIYSRNRVIEFIDDPIQNPPYMEMELLSPLNDINPGGESHFNYQIFTCTIPANSTIRRVSDFGVVSAPLTFERAEEGVSIRAKFGFFTEGILKIQLYEGAHKSEIKPLYLSEKEVNPLEGVEWGSFIKETSGWPDKGVYCKAELYSKEGFLLWEIDKNIVN